MFFKALLAIPLTYNPDLIKDGYFGTPTKRAPVNLPSALTRGA